MTKDDKRKFTLRLKESINQKLIQSSSELGVSKNAFILMALAEKLEGKKEK